MRPLNRIQPIGPPQAYKTYQVVSPRETHYRNATCEEVGCKAQANGWQTYVDEDTELGQRQAHYIRRLSGRAFSEERNEHGQTVFTFGAGQTCFATHEVRLDRPEFFLVAPGDHRRRTGETYRHTQPEDWVEDFAGHQDRIRQQLEKG